MKTIDLTVNWIFYSLLISIGAFTYGLSLKLVALSQTLTVISLILFFCIFCSLSLALSNRRYVHIDKAGLSYSLGLNTHYLPTDSIENIRVSSLGIVKVLTVKRYDESSVSFYSWRISEVELEGAKKIIGNA